MIFTHKNSAICHPILYFNDHPVKIAPFQKHLGLVLDNKLNFDRHLNEKICKSNKIIGLIKRLSLYLPRKRLLSIYKSFVRPHLDYGDVIYDRPHNETFCNQIESVQYNAALAITGAIKGTSRDRLYQELGLESLKDRRWYRRLVYFYKIAFDNSPEYIRLILPSRQQSHARKDLFRSFTCHTDYFKNSFFPYCVREWNELDPELRASTSISIFKKGLLKFIRPKPQPVYNIIDPIGLKLLTRLRVNLSHLREHKFRHNFQDTLNPLCSCSLEIETTKHYLLHCSIYLGWRKTLFDNVTTMVGTLSNLTDDQLINLLLYGDETFSDEQNTCILKNTINFLKSSQRFDIPLL